MIFTSLLYYYYYYYYFEKGVIKVRSPNKENKRANLLWPSRIDPAARLTMDAHSRGRRTVIWSLVVSHILAYSSSLLLSPRSQTVPLFLIPVGRDPPEASRREIPQGPFRFRSWIRQLLRYCLPPPTSLHFRNLLSLFASFFLLYLLQARRDQRLGIEWQQRLFFFLYVGSLAMLFYEFLIGFITKCTGTLVVFFKSVTAFREIFSKLSQCCFFHVNFITFLSFIWCGNGIQENQ